MAKTSGPGIVPDSHVVWIGRVAAAWAQLEFEIDLGIWALSGTEQQCAACITAQLMSVIPRMKALTALAAVRGASEASVGALNTFSGNIAGLVDKRNRSVHDPRMVDPKTGAIYRLEVTARPKVRFEFVLEATEDLEKTHAQIWNRVGELKDLKKRVLDEVNTLPKPPSFSWIVPLPEP